MIQRKIRALSRVLEAAEVTDDTAGQGPDGAVQPTGHRLVLGLSQLIEGWSLIEQPHRLSKVMFTRLLRLPESCQPHAPDRPEFKEEIAHPYDLFGSQDHIHDMLRRFLTP